MENNRIRLLKEIERDSQQKMNFSYSKEMYRRKVILTDKEIRLEKVL